MTQVTVELTEEQCTKVAFNCLLKTLLGAKPLMSNAQYRSYIFMLCELGDNNDLAMASKQFDNADPQCIKWNNICKNM